MTTQSRPFVLTFCNEDPVFNKTYLFDLCFADETEMSKWLGWRDDGEILWSFVESMETLFGTHDFCADLDTEFLGFQTAEIEPHKYMVVMTTWRNFFLSNKIDCSPIVETEYRDHG